MLKPKDEFYIDSVLAGDTPAFAVLVERHKNNVFNICYKILGQREEAEEVAQDIFLKVFEKLDAFKRQAKFSTWLYRIAYNTSISHQRKHKSLKQLEVEHQPVSDYSDKHFIEALEQQVKENREQRLRVAIQELDVEQQLILQWYYEKDMSINEIAQITNLSVSNIKVKLHRTRQQLYKLMQKIDTQSKTA